MRAHRRARFAAISRAARRAARSADGRIVDGARTCFAATGFAFLGLCAGMGEMMGAERFRGRKRVAHDSTATEVSVRGFLGGGAATVPSARRFRKRPSQGSEKLRLDIILIKPKIAFYYMSGDKLGWLTTDMVMGKKKKNRGCQWGGDLG